MGWHEALSSSYLNYEITHLKETERWLALVSSVLYTNSCIWIFFLASFVHLFSDMWEYLSNTTALKTPPIFASYACLYLDNEFNNLHFLSSNYHQHSKIHLSLLFFVFVCFLLYMWFKAIFNMRWPPYRIYRFFKTLQKRNESLTADFN